MTLLQLLLLYLAWGICHAEPAPPPARNGNKPSGQQAKPAAKAAANPAATPAATPAVNPAAGQPPAAEKPEPDKSPEYKKAGKEGAKPPKAPKPK